MKAFIHKKDFVTERIFPINVSQGSSHEAEDYTVVDHAHDFEEIVAIKNGSGIHVIDNVPYPVQRGDVFFIHKNQAHYFRERHEMEHINIAFDRDDLPLPMRELKQIPSYHALFDIDPQLRRKSSNIGHLRLSTRSFAEYQSIINEMLAAQAEGSAASRFTIFVCLQRILHLLFTAYERLSSSNRPGFFRFAELLSYLERNYTEKLTIDALAEHVAMSRSSFLRNFKQSVGLAPIDYINRLRIESAQELLKNSSYNLSEISQICGFDDSNYFSRVFKKKTGLPPREYRKRQLSG